MVDIESYVGSPFVCALSVDQMLGRATRDEAGFWVRNSTIMRCCSRSTCSRTS